MKNYFHSLFVSSLLLLAFISSTYAIGFKKGNIFFDATGWNYPDSVAFVVGKEVYNDDWISFYPLNPVPNTKLYFKWLDNGDWWNGVTYFAIVGNGNASTFTNYSKWFDGYISEYNVPFYTSQYTGDEDINEGTYFITKSSDQPQGGILNIISKGNPADFWNYEQTLKVQTLYNGKEWTDADILPAKLDFASYKFDGTNWYPVAPTSATATGSNNTIEITAARTATTSLSVSDINNQYAFAGWYDENGTRLSAEKTYTYYPQSAQTIYARFAKYAYRLAIKVGNNTYYSNSISAPNTATDVSFYATPEATISLQRYGGTMQWEDKATITPPDDISSKGVYTAKLTIDATTTTGTLSAIEPYDGDYYIYSANTSTNPDDGKYDGTMTKFTRYAGATYDHYWVEWLASGAGGVSNKVNTAATVGNKINTNLADSVTTDVLPYTKDDNDGANVRYSYNSETNSFARTYLAGSTHNNRFLTVFGTNLQTTDGTDITTAANGLVFSDASNWVYSAKVRVNQTEDAPKAASLKLAASYNGAYTYLLSSDGSDSETLNLITADNTLGEYPQFDIIYDYKTNRVITGWKPEGKTITQTTSVPNVLVTRTNDGPTTKFSITNGELQVTDEMVTEFVITQSMFTEWTGNEKEYNSTTYKTMLFWISLPYDCKINDIYGFDGGYSTSSGSAFEIQVYRGDLRAKGQATNQTVWQALSPYSTMKANQGYVLAVRLCADDFRDINGISEVRFFFPSKDNGKEVKVTLSATPKNTLKANTGSDAVAELQKGWNVMGVPVMDTACTFTGHSFESVYRWTWADGGRWYEPFKLLDKTEGDDKARYFNFLPGHSYMVQVGGTENNTLTWSYTQQTGTPWDAPQRTANNRLTNRDFRIDLMQDDALQDKTYILYRADGTRAYERGRDLEKIENAGRSMLYSELNDKLAIICLSDTDRVQIPLTVVAAESGEYVLQLPAPVSDAEPALYDRENGTSTLLNQHGYTIDLTAGTYRNRFYLGINPKASTPTGIGSAASDNGRVGKFIDRYGRICILRDGKLYDALGRSITAQ